MKNLWVLVGLLVFAVGCGGAESGPSAGEAPLQEARMSGVQASFTTADGQAAVALKNLYASRGIFPLKVKQVMPATYTDESGTITVLQVQVGGSFTNDPKLDPEKISGFDFDPGTGVTHWKVWTVVAGSKAHVSISS
jgi:hypothetical protein